MKVRLAKDHEMEQIKRLWSCCFDDTLEFINWYFDNRYESKNTLVICNEMNEIESSLQILPYSINIRGKQLETSYIVGVATWPKYRRKGHVRRLLHEALDIMKERKQWVSILLPFRYDFYANFDWGICYDFLLYNINPKIFDNENCIASPNIVNEINFDNDIELIDKCYNDFISGYNGFIVRTKDDWYRLWRDIQLDGGGGYIIKDSKDQLGYMLYINNNNDILIKEMAYTHISIRDSLLDFVASTICADHSKIDNSILWRAPSDDTFYFSIPDSRGALNKQAFVMGRIVDVEQALKGIKTNDTHSIVIKVKDNFYFENNKTLLLKGFDGYLQVDPTTKNPDVIISIETLSQLLWGYISAWQAANQSDMIYTNRKSIETLELLFPKKTTLLFEEY